MSGSIQIPESIKVVVVQSGEQVRVEMAPAPKRSWREVWLVPTGIRDVLAAVALVLGGIWGVARYLVPELDDSFKSIQPATSTTLEAKQVTIGATEYCMLHVSTVVKNVGRRPFQVVGLRTTARLLSTVPIKNMTLILPVRGEPVVQPICTKESGPALVEPNGLILDDLQTEASKGDVSAHMWPGDVAPFSRTVLLPRSCLSAGVSVVSVRAFAVAEDRPAALCRAGNAPGYSIEGEQCAAFANDDPSSQGATLDQVVVVLPDCQVLSTKKTQGESLPLGERGVD